MKFSALANIVDSIRALPEHHQDLELSIVLSEPSIGSIAQAGVLSICSGSDWERGKLLIGADRPLVTKTDKQALFERAFDFICAMSEASFKKRPWWAREANAIMDDYKSRQKQTN